ncbi:MAG: glucosamine-6-phosphate isomerase, partial [Candidatus Latescibacterota bacterium]
MKRGDEIRYLLSLSSEQLLERSEGRLIVLDSLDELHRHFAQSIAEEIKRNNEEGRPTRLILPVGPTGQYPILAEMINEERISLKNCYFFFMDEYCDDSGYALPPSHPLSFRGTMERLFFSRIDDELNIPREQLFFPDHTNVHLLKDKIEEVGGIDTCYGGIGIHGHLAFNEPEPNVADTDPRLVYLNAYTITMNAIRAKVGGNLENFPRKAFTLGMRQILGSRRIVLYCRNGGPYDWANTVLRLALFGEPGDDYPVTYIRGKDYLIVT